MWKRFSLAECWRLQWKILTLTATREDLLNMKVDVLPWGLFFTLLAGIGRAWDDSSAELIMRSGLPSVAYIFVLSGFLYLFIAPLRPTNWSYKRLLLLVSMTALPGLLYAIPLEMMMKPDDAATGNTAMLFLVATWRVLVLGSFLFKTTDMRTSHTVVALFLPLFLIINLLIATEKFEKTFGAMGGLRRYFVVTDEKAVNEWKDKEEEEKRKVQSRGEIYYGKTASPYPFRNSDGTTNDKIFELTDYRKNSPIPPGFKEISWDNPNYMPPGLFMTIIRPLGKVSWYAAPLLAAYYVCAMIYGIYLSFKSRRPPK